MKINTLFLDHDCTFNILVLNLLTKIALLLQILTKLLSSP